MALLFLLTVALLCIAAHCAILESYVCNGDLRSFQQYLHQNKEAALEHNFESEYYGKGHLIHMIVEKNKIDPQKFLQLALEIGVDIDSLTRDGLLNRPLGLAARFGNLEAVKYLLEKGASLHVLNQNSRTRGLRS